MRGEFCCVFIFVSLIALSLELALALESSDGWNTDGGLSYNLMKDGNVATHGTKLFRHRPGLHVRHDFDFLVMLQPHKCDEPFLFELVENDNSIFTWTQRPLVQDGILHFRLHINRSIPVGQYTLNTNDPCSEEEMVIHLGDVNVMFHPGLVQWDTGDARIRRQASAFNEYLENNCGYIWTGPVAIPWDYAVGSQVVVDSRNRLLHLMSQEERSDPVLYSRALTRLIGSNVLFGRWDGQYSDGIEPTQWVGSEGILASWLETGQRVRYGQCWVFAALLTTILRDSGISARTVTNYNSHHDRGLTDNRQAVLRQYDNIKQTDESTWNFHVWSEAWLARPDLGQPFSWNAVDATPQEPSPLAPNQPFQAGPAYVPFISSNVRAANYDTYFILAEVNALDICPLTGMLIPGAAGYAVVTKLPGLQPQVYNYNNPEYITDSYKISSTSKRASESNPVLPPPYIGCERDGGMRLNSTPISPQVGESFIITVTEGNVSVRDTIIRMELRNYMGESLGFISNFTGTKELSVAEVDYLPYLRNSSIFRFSVGENNESGDFIFHDALRIRLEYGQLGVEATKGTDSTTITLMLIYTNPLSVPMTGVMLSISSPSSTYIRLEQPDIPAGTRFTTTVEVECGDNDNSDVMIPISLDSDVTQSAYGTGWSSCTDGPLNGGSVTLSGISGLQMMLLSLLALSLCDLSVP